MYIYLLDMYIICLLNMHLFIKHENLFNVHLFDLTCKCIYWMSISLLIYLFIN